MIPVHAGINGFSRYFLFLTANFRLYAWHTDMAGMCRVLRRR